MTRQFLTLVMAIAALGLSGCATKKYVAQTVEPVEDRVDRLEGGLEETRGELRQTKQQLDSTTETANTADRRAGEALNRADAASAKAEQIRGQLRTELQQTIANLEDYRLAGNAVVYFDFDSAELTDAARAELDRLVAAHRNSKRFFITLQGHTDQIGSEEYNLRLSQRRAEAVKRYLVAQHGLPLYRVHIIGLGEQKPVEEGRTREARALNRRVEINVFSADAAVAGGSTSGTTPTPEE